MSAVVGHKTLFLMEIDNTDHPVELAFQPRYGDIVAYTWYVSLHDGLMLLNIAGTVHVHSTSGSLGPRPNPSLISA